jgi:peptide chain release factor 2
MPPSSRSGCADCVSATTSSGGVFDLPGLTRRQRELEELAASPDLWEDREGAERVLRERSALERELAGVETLRTAVEDAEVLLDLAIEEADADTLRETATRLAEAEAQLEDAEVRRILGGEHDDRNAIVSINAGAGGTDACDWAEMLLRMYLRWAERRGFGTEILDLQAGEEAGVRSVTFTVSGERAFGHLKVEEGVHRLVRISPFDAQHRRHTAFASVGVFPEIDESVEVEIEDKDLRVDTYRAGGAGGQHVNKTDSAVRITHLPTGIVVQCQNERSQHKNRAQALKVLRARLYEHARREQEEIRSYTLHPSQRVKDHRTGVEVGNTSGVLDGDLDPFIRAALLARAETRGAA